MTETPQTPDNPTPEAPGEAANRRVVIIVAAVVAAILLLGLLWWYVSSRQDATPEPTPTPTPTQTAVVTTDPTVTTTDVVTTEVVETTDVVTTTDVVETTEVITPAPTTDDTTTTNIDTSNLQQNKEGTPDFAALMYLRGSQAIRYTDTTPSDWLETAKPYMSARLYEEKKAILDASGGTNSPQWQQIVKDQMIQVPYEPKLMVVSDGGDVKTVQASFKTDTRIGSTRTISDMPRVMQFRVIQENGAWVVDQEQQIAN